MADALNWFEIPAADIQRAARFYGEILQTTLHMGQASSGYSMAMFPSESGVGGALVQGESYVPSTTGSLIYLNGGEDLSDILGRVESAGGRVLMPKRGIGENGFVAFFQDSEGNRVALHSMH